MAIEQLTLASADFREVPKADITRLPVGPTDFMNDRRLGKSNSTPLQRLSGGPTVNSANRNPSHCAFPDVPSDKRRSEMGSLGQAHYLDEFICNIRWRCG